MEAGFLFLGMAVGVVIGLQYYKHQILHRKNPRVIKEVKGWIEEAER